MPKVSEQYRKERRREIMSAVLKCFARKGIKATSITDIITESGLSAGAIYGHFGNKEELVLFVVSEVFDLLGEETGTNEPSAEVPHPAQLIRGVLARIRTEIGNPALLLQIWGEAVTEPKVRELFNRVYGVLSKQFSSRASLWFQEHGLSEAEADRRAAQLMPLLIGVGQGYMIQSTLIDSFDDQAYFESFENLLSQP
ncbi:TetR/AcrR family transcriptional regulator [Psychromicrobium lacuslunae]|uniref:TetR/AcrR family transcriptional regulator n=1 Tax=Psychromicrobium lacuslunae TaxID=1618207 RepID=UPI0006970043|nr:TetR/AcrR family transcriptional regulator [Psychromicrobium lacuslunae]